MSKRIVVVYRRADIERNKFAIGKFIEYLPNAELAAYEDLIYGIDRGKLFIDVCGHSPDIIINRSREPRLSRQAELMGIKAYNPAAATEIANNKNLAYQTAAHVGVPVADTAFVIDSALPKYGDALFKKVDSYGGKDVSDKCGAGEYACQKRLDGVIGDIRTYVVGGKPIVSMLRPPSADGLRCNYSLSRTAEVYELNAYERACIDKICAITRFDYVGIDLLKTADGSYFNEIEDPVGAKAVYETTDIDPIKLYCDLIRAENGL